MMMKKQPTEDEILMKQALILEDISDTMEMLLNVVVTAFPAVECKPVASISDAQAFLDKATPDLALIDLELPDGSGIEVIERLNRACPQCHIVVITIFDDDLHLFPALQAGAQGYLLKEQPRDLLVRQLKNIANGEPPLSPAIARRLLKHFQKTPEISPVDHRLTPRESEILTLLARAARIAEIAEKLGISPHTVGDHTKSIYRKLNISSRAEAVLRARELGLS
jgi:DNA-binding NarL/FixJ family response regulator